jgi:dipeptidyl aminopeptidase/acylaminoacyl peptidase
VYLISPAGGEARRLTRLSTGASSIKWFADGRRLAFLSWVWPDLETDAQQAARLKERQEAKVRAWVIDTTRYRHWDHWLADGREPHLFVADVATGECRDLLAGTGLSLAGTHESLELPADLYDVSPDGGEVALTVDLGPDPGFAPNHDIVILPVAGGPWTNLTAENPAHDHSPRYSPDGRWIAYLRQSIPHFYADRQQIALYERRSGTIRILAAGWDRSATTPPAWSPDAGQLYFTAEDRARQPVWVLDREGDEPRPLVQGGTVTGFDLSRDGRTLAFVQTTMSRPAALFAAPVEGGGAARLEAFNDELVAQWDLGPVQEEIYPGWGEEPVQAWVIYPPGFDARRKWPLLQIVHGGPHGAWMDQFHFRWNMHLFASRGYVVMGVNFHGSTGWGQAFTDANTGQYGTKELEDVERGTDDMLAQGYIDPERLAAAGGSFGGYMVAWMNGHTDRYKAYVCHAGVFDYVAQTASDAVRGRERALGAFPWDDPERVLAQSAHSYAKAFKTPTLVIHGEQDFRVPVTQGFQYYTTLRMRGVPSRLVYYPDENHWILKPQNSRLWYNEFFNWVEKWVRPGGE